MAVPFLACMAAAAAFYHLPPRALPAIHAVEGGAVGVVSPNTNGTADLGVMQINTIWLPDIARAAKLPEQKVKDRLVNDGCFNIAAAAAILRMYLNETRGDLMRAIGNYHSHTPALNTAYQERVLRAAAKMFKPKE